MSLGFYGFVHPDDMKKANLYGLFIGNMMLSLVTRQTEKRWLLQFHNTPKGVKMAILRAKRLDPNADCLSFEIPIDKLFESAQYRLESPNMSEFRDLAKFVKRLN